jgi:O-antigen/teichoic acid export membrane protein
LGNIVDDILALVRNVSGKGFFHLLSANIFLGFSAFGSQVLVAKFLTPLELGQIKTMQSILNVATIAAGFGFNTSVLKLCSEARPSYEKYYIFKKNVVLTLVPAVVTMCSLYILSSLGFLSPDKAVSRLLPIYMLTVPAAVYASLIMVYLQALKRIVAMAKLQSIVRLLGYVILILATYFYGMTGFIAASLITGYVALIPLVSSIKNEPHRTGRVNRVFSESIYYARWSVAANIVNTTTTYMDIFLLNFMIKDRIDLGYYSLATIFIMGLNYVTTTAQSISIPYYSEKSSSKEELLRVLRKYQILMAGVALIAAVLVFIAVGPFVSVVYGPNFASAATYTRILTLKYLFWSCYSLLSAAIFGMGKVKYNCFTALISLFMSVVLGYVSILYYGLIGAAVSQVVTQLLTLMLMVYMLRRMVVMTYEVQKG